MKLVSVILKKKALLNGTYFKSINRLDYKLNGLMKKFGQNK